MKFRISKFVFTILSSLLLLASEQATHAQYSLSVGFTKLGGYDSGNNYIGLLGASDTIISIPYLRKPEFQGTFEADDDWYDGVLQVKGSPGWTTNQFVYSAPGQPKTYFALIETWNEGTYALPILANSANTITIDSSKLGGHPAGVSIIPYWTPASLFPASDSNVTFTPTSATNDLKTQILIPNYDSTTTNSPYAATYYFYNGAWRLGSASSTVSHDNDPLPLDGYICVRNPNGTTTKPFIARGSVLSSVLSTAFTISATSEVDNYVSYVSPFSTTLDQLALELGNGFTDSPNYRAQGDRLFLYDNAVAATVKAPYASFYRYNGAWRRFGDPPTNTHGSFSLRGGSALIIRKATAYDGTEFWHQPH